MNTLIQPLALLVLVLTLVWPSVLQSAVKAEERTMDAQLALKDQGLYYSGVDGIMGEETVAAIRRYQIRYGLEVNGELDDETSEQLGLEKGRRSPSVSPLPDELKPEAKKKKTPARSVAGSPKNTRKSETTIPLIVKDDQKFLRKQEARDAERERVKAQKLQEQNRVVIEQTQAAQARQYQPVQVPVHESQAHVPAHPQTVPFATTSQLLAHSPFSRAPSSVKREVLTSAQIALARAGYYREPVDGYPGPATQWAIHQFQHDRRLPPTGELDTSTLHRLGIMRASAPPNRRRVYRGVWVR